jgi:hypothetical protein
MLANAKSRLDDPTAAQQRFYSLFLRSGRENFHYPFASVAELGFRITATR